MAAVLDLRQPPVGCATEGRNLRERARRSCLGLLDWLAGWLGGGRYARARGARQAAARAAAGAAAQLPPLHQHLLRGLWRARPRLPRGPAAHVCGAGHPVAAPSRPASPRPVGGRSQAAPRADCCRCTHALARMACCVPRAAPPLARLSSPPPPAPPHRTAPPPTHHRSGGGPRSHGLPQALHPAVGARQAPPGRRAAPVRRRAQPAAARALHPRWAGRRGEEGGPEAQAAGARWGCR